MEITDPRWLRLHTGLRLPERLVQTVRQWNQTDLTPDWLQTIPDAIEAVCRHWRISLEPVLADTAVTLVLFGTSPDLGPVVIKSSPLADELLAEATALRLGAGSGVVRLHEFRTEQHILLEERIVPGTQLRESGLSDEAATRIAAACLATFWRPVADPAGLRPLDDWMHDLFVSSPATGIIDGDLLQLARQLGEFLLDTAPAAMLLHGDFQHQNLLQRANGDWVMIDPKGLIGDPGFEIAAWMYNPPGIPLDATYSRLAAKRLALCADLWGIDRARLTAWAFVGAVLSACWSASDGVADDWFVATIAAARQLQKLLE